MKNAKIHTPWGDIEFDYNKLKEAEEAIDYEAIKKWCEKVQKIYDNLGDITIQELQNRMDKNGRE